MTPLGIVKVFCEIKSVEGAYYMTEVKFYEEAADELLKFAVIIAKSGDKWIFCKHRDRDTWEAPGGEESFGMLYYADVKTFEEELHSEIERIMLMRELPKEWTYPEIQPRLLAEASKRMESGQEESHA